MSGPPSNYLIYDGECPFCSRFARLTKLRETVGELRLIDARERSPEVIAAKESGFVLDNEMLLLLNGQSYYGADCLNRLALLSSRSALFNQLTYALLRHRWVSTWAYPILRFGRSVALKLLGRKQLGY